MADASALPLPGTSSSQRGLLLQRRRPTVQRVFLAGIGLCGAISWSLRAHMGPWTARYTAINIGAVTFPPVSSLRSDLLAVAEHEPALVHADESPVEEPDATALRPSAAVSRPPAPAPALLQGDDAALDLWTRFPDGMDEVTREAQALIHQNQHPEDCQDRDFLLWEWYNSGMGAEVHFLGAALGQAVQMGRTLLYSPDSSMDCYFLPLSKCQYMADALVNATDRLPRFDNKDRSYQGERFVLINDRGLLENKLQRRVPDVRPDWPARGLRWWTGQTSRYIVRLNPGTRDWARAFLQQTLTRYPMEGGGGGNWNAALFPPPEAAICMHVRHGDKHAEMKLHHLSEYLAKATSLVRMQGAAPVVILTTDDEAVIEQVEGGQARLYQLDFYYTRHERVNRLSPMATARALGPSHFARVSLASLVLGVHPSCRWFVQTGASNWNRLIDEIRATDGQRENATWIDLEPNRSKDWGRMRRRKERRDR